MTKSQQIFDRAQQFIPGGVNSPVRSFAAVGGNPLIFSKGEGAYMVDVDGQRYIDYVGSWGPLILGHCHPKIMQAVHTAVDNGLSYGACCETEVKLAEKICKIMSHIEQVRCVNSGTEATMSAIRLARGYTGRDKIIKFEGCYHGHSDALLVKAGSGALTFGVPSSPGVPASFTEHTLVATFNDLDSVQAHFEKHGDNIACIILEPVTGNMNCVPGEPAFIQGLRDLCDQYKTVLIFDEVMTGFRIGLGGAQAYYGITPDLTTLGKVIGGGMPVGAFGGKRDIMQYLAPVGPVYQAGTLSGNPIAMAAGLTNLIEISKPGFYEQLSQTTEQLMQGLQERAQAANIPLATQAIGGMFGIFFTQEPSVNYFEQVMACNLEHFNRFFHGMLNAGVYFAPSAYEAGFVSSSHSPDEIETTLLAAEQVFNTLTD